MKKVAQGKVLEKRQKRGRTQGFSGIHRVTQGDAGRIQKGNQAKKKKGEGMRASSRLPTREEKRA